MILTKKNVATLLYCPPKKKEKKIVKIKRENKPARPLNKEKKNQPAIHGLRSRPCVQQPN